MPLYCRPEHVTDLILSQVVDAAEALNADLVARSIEIRHRRGRKRSFRPLQSVFRACAGNYSLDHIGHSGLAKRRSRSASKPPCRAALMTRPGIM